MCAAARPVVNGLAERYANDVAFFDPDATTAEGKAKEREFGMVFHGYAILDRWGRLYWHSAGHQFTAEELEQKLKEALSVPPPSP